ncbi:MAG: DNA polymerase III subunit delta' C-terminal domain-containing protein, partial [Gammaproteobacteria bacterium]
IQPSEPGKIIGVDQIRALIDSIQLKPQYDAYRIVIIDPADQMNKSSFNAFLKCLEEPTERTLVFLITEKPASLPATINSRCQKLVIDTPAISAIHLWLKQQNINEDLEILTAMAQNSPLLAKRYAEEQTLLMRNDCLNAWVAIAKQQANPVLVAESWLKWPHNTLLFWLSTWLVDLIRCFYDTKASHFYNPDYRPLLKEFAGQLDLKGIYTLYDLILISRQRLDTPIHKQLMFEEILIRWSELNRSRSL